MLANYVPNAAALCLNFKQQNCGVLIILLQKEKTLTKIMTIEKLITQEIAQRCKCQYSSSFIADGHLFCTIKNNVIYQAQLFSTDSKTGLEIRNITQDWVLSKPFLKIDGVSYQLDPGCSVVVKELGITACDYEATSQSTVNVTELASFIGGGCVLMILVIVVVIILVSCWSTWSCRKKHDKRLN